MAWIKTFLKKIMKTIECVWNELFYRSFDLFSVGGKAKKNRITLLWWNAKINLGDYLACVVYDWMLKEKQLDKNKHVNDKKGLMTIGSIITIGSVDAVVWGSGLLSVKRIPVLLAKSCYRKLDVRAVRGPLTRHVLVSAGYVCPEVYGDPAILMPYIYCPTSRKKKFSVSVIEHFSKSEELKRTDLNYINIETYDYKYFIDEVCASNKIVSSSLHGIILAETYGVPAVFLSDGMEEQLFKFWDWYLSTGRTDIRVAKTLDEALKMEPMPLPQLDEMRDKLITCFPVDLWKED